jgi:hypothetical protein
MNALLQHGHRDENCRIDTVEAEDAEDDTTSGLEDGIAPLPLEDVSRKNGTNLLVPTDDATDAVESVKPRDSSCGVEMMDTDIHEDRDLFTVGTENDIAPKNGALILLAGIMSGIPMTCMMDSGASTRYMSRKAAELAGWKSTTRAYGNVRVANGKTIPILGKYSCYSRFEGIDEQNNFQEYGTFTIVEMEPYDVILGMDFWNQYRATPDYRTGGMRLYKKGRFHKIPPEKKYFEPTLTVSVLEDLSDLDKAMPLITWRQTKKILEHGRGKTKGYEDMELWILRPLPEGKHLIYHLSTNMTTDSTKSDLGRQIRGMEGEFHDVLRPELPVGVEGKHQDIEHDIDTQDARPINLPYYRLSPEHLDEQRKQIELLLEKKLIRPSNSPWGAPVLFVKKPKGEWRMCVDYRALNDATVKKTFPLPRIQEQIDQTGNAKVFSKIDLLSGFWQIRMAKQSIEKTAFNTRDGKYEFLVMPFGLTGAPPTFQATMNNLLRDYLNKFVVVYIDDVLIYSQNEEEHAKHLRMILEKLREGGFYAKPSKCIFGVREIEFCGHVIGDGKVRMTRNKVDAVKDWPQPTTVHQVRQFVGLCSYYRRFIRGFARLAAPLHELLKTEGTNKHRQITWNYACARAFQELKDAISSEPVLAQPDPAKPYIIETDASDFARGAQLLQVGSDGKEHPVAFESRKFTPAERNYPTHERELLAIKDALRAWNVYIENGFTTIVRTDHAGLQYMNTTKVVSKRLARWIDEFGGYDLDIRYKPGPQMVVADALSRRPDYKEDNSLNTLTLQIASMDLVELMHEYLKNGNLPDDETDATMIKSRSDEFRLQDDKIEEDGGELQHRTSRDDPWITVLPHWARQDELDYYHRRYGHCGEVTLYDLMKDRVWWPTIKKDVRGFCRYCTECQLAGRRHQSLHRAPMVPSTEWKSKACDAFDRWGLDLIGKLKKTNRGNIWIATAVDYVTKWPVARALPDAKAETLAEFLYDLYMNYGVPKEIITDQGANLWAPAMKLFMKKLGAHHMGTTAYNPRTNGAVESLNGTLGNMLTKYLAGQSTKHWDLYLDGALFAARVRTHSTTKKSPFFMLYGRHPRLPRDQNDYTPLDWSVKEDRLPIFQTSRQEARLEMEKRAEANKRQWEKDNKNLVEAERFKEGEYVLVRNEKKEKFDLNWYGPYLVVQEVTRNVYKLRTIAGRDGKNGVELPRLIAGDRLHKARVDGKITRAWNMPGKRTRQRTYGSEADPRVPITVPVGLFVPLPREEVGDVIEVEHPADRIVATRANKEVVDSEDPMEVVESTKNEEEESAGDVTDVELPDIVVDDVDEPQV